MKEEREKGRGVEGKWWGWRGGAEGDYLIIIIAAAYLSLSTRGLMLGRPPDGRWGRGGKKERESEREREKEGERERERGPPAAGSTIKRSPRPPNNARAPPLRLFRRRSTRPKG